MRERERLAGRKAPGTTDPARTIQDKGDGFLNEGLDEREGGCSPGVRVRRRRRRRVVETEDREETLGGWVRVACSVPLAIEDQEAVGEAIWARPGGRGSLYGSRSPIIEWARYKVGDDLGG